MKIRSFLLPLLLLLFFKNIQSQIYSFKPIPPWVKEVGIPENPSVSKYDVLSGYYLSLADYQINLEENKTFTRQVINVISIVGITNASQLAVALDTAYQHLQIHHLYIWRKGKKHDRTDSLSFEKMNNEQNLNQGIYTGQITMYDILKDIRKDDLIDFAYTMEGINPIFENEKYVFLPMESLNPIDLYSVRILYRNDKNYSFQCQGCDSIISTSLIDEYKVIEMQRESLPAMKYEDFIPSSDLCYDYFTLSSFTSWKHVNEWAQRVFVLKEEPKLTEVFEEIFTGNETTDEKINGIINYVQDDIRYMGIESGIGSIKPFPPDQVVRRRFGDCKDKSLLMVSLLKSIGIQKAYPALVNTVLKNETANHFPGNQMFNHCIVTFEYDNQTYWVDPTLHMQGGSYKELYCPDYGKALIIGLPADSLQSISIPESHAFTEYFEELTANSFSSPATLKIKSVRYGSDADNRRSAMEYVTINNITDELTNELKLLYPGVNQKDTPEIQDDIQKNTFTTTYDYEVEVGWHDGDQDENLPVKGYWTFKYEPLTVYQYLNLPVFTERNCDFQLNYPLHIKTNMVFHFPKDLFIVDQYKRVDNEAYLFEEKIEQLSKNSLQITYIFKTKTDRIKAKDYIRISDASKKLIQGLPLIFYFNK
ncbi:MAG: DUF3857 domain-containing transglutaminase family protein [Bacteroidales bacterium]|nr:DUF3857 domain-containing transglutaminase family protein [Bacteroidales bacterium]